MTSSVPVLFLLLAAGAAGPAPRGKSAAAAARVAEQRAAQHLEAIRHEPPLLRAFLRDFPKGADLHHHLSGAVYAESYIQWAADTGLCVDLRTLTLVSPASPPAAGAPPCGREPLVRRPASDALTDGALFNALVDALSTRHFKPERESGDVRFFDTFARFSLATRGRTGDMLAEVTRRAARQGVLHLEVMLGLDEGTWRDVTARVSWRDDLPALHRALVEVGTSEMAARARALLDAAEARMHDELGCGTAAEDPGCKVRVRYLAHVGRAQPRERVFAQMVAAFEIAQADPRVVGVNLVQPEHHPVAMRDYALHMRMLEFLHVQYPDVAIALHAGELAYGLVPPEALGTHVPEALRIGHARRIGHGTDVLYHPSAPAVLREMAERRVAVEVSLSSSDIILGVRGARHPLRHYLAAGVAVALVTDDEGVSRSDLTHEYQRAVEEQGLGYADLKRLSRNSLEHSFLPGRSLWAETGTWRLDPACARPQPRVALAPECQTLLESSPKAALQWKLEEALRRFESGLPPYEGRLSE